MATRRYDQRLRAETAEQTRRAILDAAYARLRAAPGRAAGHWRGGRGGGRRPIDCLPGLRLTSGAVRCPGDRLLERGRVDRLIEAVGHPDAREQLRGAIRASCDMFAVDRDVRRALVSMSALDPAAVGGAIERGDENRRRGTAQLAGRLQEQGLLQPGVTRDDAAHLLWVLSSFDSFDSLYVGYGLDVDATCRVLTGTAERALLR